MNGVVKGSKFQLENAVVRYKNDEALRGVSIGIEPGESVALIGASGSGKSTLLNALNGSVRVESGAVKVNGRDLMALDANDFRRIRAHIGFIHQHLNLLPNVRALHNVLLGRLGEFGLFESIRHFIWPPVNYVEEIYGLLERVGIPEKLYARTDRLSGGQQQRVAVARALFQNPQALLADEPVSNVDPARARNTVELIVGLARESGLTLVMSLHNFELAREFFPRLIGLRRGTVLFDLPVSQVTPDQIRELYHLESGELLQSEIE